MNKNFWNAFLIFNGHICRSCDKNVDTFYFAALRPCANENISRMEFHQLSRVRKLYKIILKLHRGLPSHLKTIGDVYTRDEFKRHKKCKPVEEAIFVEEWTKYALLLTQQLGLKGPKSATTFGCHLTRSQLDKMSDYQIQKLYEVLLATQGKDPKSSNVEESEK